MKIIYDNDPFPDYKYADEDGLLAIGNELTTKRLLEAYQSGIFPWYRSEGFVFWYCPSDRLVLFPSSLKISSSLKKLLRSNRFTITENKDFEAVIKSCSTTHNEKDSGTWIDDEFIKEYIKMNQLGYGYSVEVWQHEILVGGIYGIKLGKVFCGESMFSKVTNASKVAITFLCQSQKFLMIYCQVPSDHLISLGAEVVSRNRFLELLKLFVEPL
jgi:leucyl/phenylalanyl-tRNA--protein transferase